MDTRKLSDKRNYPTPRGKNGKFIPRKPKKIPRHIPWWAKGGPNTTGHIMSKEECQKISDRNSVTFKKKWQEPEFRRKQINRVKKWWANPDNRKHQSRIMRENAGGMYRETTLERKVVNWARHNGILVFKTDPKHCAGAPDRIFFIPGGKPFLIEFKRPDGQGTVSELQKFIIKQLRAARYDVAVIDNEKEAIRELSTRLEPSRVSAKGRKISTR